MGYDMHMVRKPAQIPPGHRPQYDDQPHYHRFTIHWMPVMREMMQRADVLDEYGEPFTPLPAWPPAGIDRDRASTLMEHPEGGGPWNEPPPSAAEKQLLDEYEREREKVCAEISPDPGRVGYW